MQWLAKGFFTWVMTGHVICIKIPQPFLLPILLGFFPLLIPKNVWHLSLIYLVPSVNLGFNQPTKKTKPLPAIPVCSLRNKQQQKPLWVSESQPWLHIIITWGACKNCPCQGHSPNQLNQSLLGGYLSTGFKGSSRKVETTWSTR